MGSLRKCVLAFLLCGSLNTIARKIAYSMFGTADDHAERFQKPWFATFVMFVAMASVLPFDAGNFACRCVCVSVVSRRTRPVWPSGRSVFFCSKLRPAASADGRSCSPGGCQALCLNCQSSLRFNAETPTTARPPIECHGTMCGEQGD
ncbi:unnamed protein product [Effrenium voratum]|nr:unnamed protein product [Effrenium voratum]